MPNPHSRSFHRLPVPLHKAEALANHVTQLVVPFGLLLPQPVAGVAAAVIAVTQSWLVASGNFSWLNLTTIVLALVAIPDTWYGAVLPLPGHPAAGPGPLWWQVVVLAVAALVAVLSWQPVRNLLSGRQVMNRSFNKLHLVNTYGAFGSVTRVRYEVVIEATDDPEPGPETVWQAYEFKGKPGDPRRRPPQVAPYHLRLDWMMWFAALSPGYGQSWLPALLARLLEGDKATLKLLRRVPIERPAWVRARYYRYRFTTAAERRETGNWWERTLVGEYIPAVQLSGDDLVAAPTRAERG
jgi:hypothetical protein